MTTRFVNVRQDLPVSRNPWAYCAPDCKVPDLKPPPANFSDRGVRAAERSVMRPRSAVRSLVVPEKFPMRLTGVAPADQVPIYECGTRPSSAVRAFVSNRSNGTILYQGSYVPSRPVPK